MRDDADITIGSRLLDDLPMTAANKYGNKAANYLIQRLLHLPDADVSTGFRAYTREAAMRLNVRSDHTYTHETLINALDQHLSIVNVPIAARHVTRPSRLIKSVTRHVLRAGTVMLRSLLLYRPMQVYGLLGATLLSLGALPFARYAYFVVQGDRRGHTQSLIVGSALWIIGGQLFITAMLALAISWNRRMLEDVLFRMKEERSAARSVKLRRERLTRVYDQGAQSGDDVAEGMRHAT